MKSDKSEKKIKDNQPKTKMSLMGRAMLWSLIPGAGQIYLSKYSNRPKWIGRNPWVWKLPIIYGGLGVSAYFIYKNQTEHKLYRQTYIDRNDAGDVNVPLASEGSKTFNLDGTALIAQQDQYQNYRDLSIFIFVGVYLLNIVDAGVQAHFCRFDVSPDLTLSIEPAMPSFNSFGAGLKLNFK
ncbi:MAG: hypothetical protein KDC84_07010 [Crocinitomicaceae bacterium]|nr:hypothetical protein [Crocinitomicaceae bacterium]